MMDAEIDALLLAHQDAGDMRAFARAVADAAKRAALAEPAAPQSEPVAWMDIDSDGNRSTVRQWSDGNRDEVPLYTAPPAAPQGEPAAMILKGSLDSLRAYQRVDTALYRPGFEPEQEWCEPLYASPPAAPSVPAGWRLVPVEPTREMREAGERALCSWLAPALHAADAYRAMIDVAPSGEESK